MLESILFTVVPLLVLLALIGGVVFGIMAITRRRGLADADPGIGTVRRLYFYIVSFVALMMAAAGVALILQFILDTLFGGDLLSPTPSRRTLATGLSLAVVGLPLWALHWRIIGKQLRELPVETRSAVRKVYIYIAMAVSVGFVVGGAIAVIRWALGGTGSFNGAPWAQLVVWGAVWAFHWRLEAEEGQPTPETRAVRRLYLYLVSAVMLVTAAVGIGLVIHVILRGAYESLASVSVLSKSGLWQTSTKQAVSMALVASSVWAGHWLYFARRDYQSTLRQLYVYALAVFGGISTVLSALGIMLYGSLVWALGVPEDELASAHFRFLPGALASLIVGGGILAYHASVAREEAGSAALAMVGGRRSYPYALTALGLGTLSVGIVILVSTALTMLVESGSTIISGRDVWRNWVLASVTLGVLGGPLWWYYWASVQSRVNAGDIEEQTSLSRRVLTFGVLGAGMLALLVSVSVVVFVFLRELLDGDLSIVLREAKGAIAVIVPAAIFLPHYWMVYRADRREAPGPEAAVKYQRKVVTALVTDDGTAFAKELETVLGYPVGPLHWADSEGRQPELSDTGYRDLAQRISDAEGVNVLLVPDGVDFRVLSYR